MKFQLAIFSAAIACCTANRAVDLSVDIPANSKLGSDILSKARRVGQNEEEVFYWQNNYSIRFDSCHTIHQFGGDGEGQQQEEGSNPIGNQHLVKFKLCPSDTNCSQCKKGGEYVVKMREFLEVYLETKKELEEAQCATVEENCVCNYDDGDDDVCLAQCYAEAGLDFCVEDEEFDANEYLECAEAAFSNDAYYAYTFFIGPVCGANGNSINLGLFKDQTCSIATDNNNYNTYSQYNTALPYSQESLVDNECISCKEVDENAYYNQNNNYYNANNAADPIELCQQLYMQSAKCEKKMSGKSYPDTGSCQYINHVIGQLEKVYKRNGSSGTTATVFAWLFFMTTLAASAGLFYFFNLSKRTNVDLSSNTAGSGML